MKKPKKESKVSASDVLNILEFLHSGISWLPEDKVHKTQIGSIDITFNPKTSGLEFRGPSSFVSVSCPSENTAKRMISSLKSKLIEARGTNDILESLLPISNVSPDIEVIAFWGL